MNLSDVSSVSGNGVSFLSFDSSRSLKSLLVGTPGLLFGVSNLNSNSAFVVFTSHSEIVSLLFLVLFPFWETISAWRKF